MSEERPLSEERPSPLRVLLIAGEAAGGRVLRLLRSAPAVSLEAVLPAPDPHGRMGSVRTAAERAGCRLIPARRVEEPELAEELAELDLDLILNVHSLHIVHPSLLELPRLGAYNLHPGPLPEMAGLNAPSWAILLGHGSHGVTLHRMSAGIDDGAVAYEDRFPIDPNATGLTLSLECVSRGVKLVARLLETVAAGRPIPARVQDLSRRAYFDRKPPDGGSIRFGQPGENVAAHLRAADYRPFPSPWGHPRVVSTAGEVALLSAEVVEDGATGGATAGTVRLDGDRALVACVDGWVVIERVRVDGAVRAAGSVLRDGEVLATLAGVADKPRSGALRKTERSEHGKVASPPDRAHL